MPALFLLLSGVQLSGQTQPTPTEEKDETIVLSPFVVQAEQEDQGYSARSTLAGTRIRTDLKDVGSSISVVTKQFLLDTNSTSNRSLLVYTANTEVSGQGGNFLGRGDGAILTSTFDQQPLTTTRVRGLTDADNTRDFYLSDIPWDSYNTGRVDLQRGPNSILFGIGSPAGIVNASLNGASFKNSNKVELQVSSFNSNRATADFNRVLIPKELALRISLLRDDTKYRQDPAYRDDHRFYAAGKWDPAFLNRGSAHTSLRVNFEKGNINSNLPRDTPPLDAIMPWFSHMGKRVYNPADPLLGGLRDTDPTLDRPGHLSVFSAYIQNNAGGGQESAFFPVDRPGTSYVAVGPATWDQYALRSRLPYASIGGYKAKSLTDRSIFDYYNNLLDGPNKHEFNGFTAYNVSLGQTFFNDRLGFELAYDRQEVRWGNTSFLTASSASVTIDILTTVPFGAANPNLRRPMVVSSGGGGFWQERTREVKRATAFAEINFADFTSKGSLLTTIFGRNTITAVASEDKRDNLKGSFRNYVVGDAFVRSGLSDFRQDLYMKNYLGPAIATTATTAAGLNLQGIKGKITPTSTTVLINPDGSTAANPLPPITTALPIISNQDLPDSAKEYGAGNKFDEKVTSMAAVWQGYWLKGTLVPMVGVRKDKQIVRTAGTAPAVQLNGRTIADIWSPNWAIPNSAGDIPTPNPRGIDINRTEATSRTYSLVTHLPESWREKLPGRMDISVHYNQSQNIQPAAGRRDLFGDSLPDPAGDTKEYGITFRALDDKVSLKIAHFKTKVTDANLADRIPNAYVIGVADAAWATNRAWHFKNLPGDLGQHLGPAYAGRYGLAGTIYGYSSSGKPVTWRPAGPLPPTGDPAHPVGWTETTYDAQGHEVRTYHYNYTQAQLDATYAKQEASINDWFAHPLPDKMIAFWGLTDYKTGPTPGVTDGFNLTGPKFIARHDPPEPGFVVTGDTESEGYEAELAANPIKGLNLAVNVSKTTATRNNLAKSFVDFVEARYALMAGPMGDMRIWGPDDSNRADPAHGGDTIRNMYAQQFMPGYRLFRALEGAEAPEIRPWAVNAIGSYTFQDGLLRGALVGGGYRWAQADIIGFAGKTENGVESYDLTKPFKGPAQSAVDLWIGYTRSIRAGINWRIQLNVRNAFGNNKLIPVTRQVDGTPAAYRLPEPTTWALTNTLEF